MGSLLVAALVAVTALVALPPDVSTAASDSLAAPPAPTATTAAAEPPRNVDLRGDHPEDAGGDHDRLAGRLPAAAWPRGTIRYHETMPAKWQWGLDRAIAHWNGSGAQVRFVKVASRRRAQVTIGYGQTYGSDGYGGWTARGSRIFKGFVAINPSYRRVDEGDDEQRVWMGRLIAHELGHVLGYDHTRGRCSLMAPIFYFGECGPLSPDKVGYYPCRWIDLTLLRAHVRTYGGRAARPPRDCLIHPRPAAMSGVIFDGGGDGSGGGSPVRITWRPITQAATERVRVVLWAAAGECATEPVRVDEEVLLPRTATSWVDPFAGRGTACYRVQGVNHSGLAGPAVAALRQRFAAVPPAPAVSALVWRPLDQEFRFTWSASPGQQLMVQRDGVDPATCPATYDPTRAEELYPVDGHYTVRPDGHPSQCLAFFAVNQVGDASPATTQTATVPPPGATPPTLTGPVTYDQDLGSWLLTATSPDGADIDFEVRAGPCSTVPADAEWYAGYRLDGDRYAVYVNTGLTGPHCAYAAVFDDFGRRGGVASISWDVTAS